MNFNLTESNDLLQPVQRLTPTVPFNRCRKLRLSAAEEQIVRSGASKKFLRPMYVVRQNKRVAGQTIAATIENPRSLARLAGISRENRAYSVIEREPTPAPAAISSPRPMSSERNYASITHQRPLQRHPKSGCHCAIATQSCSSPVRKPIGPGCACNTDVFGMTKQAD